jgi:hypothetical protein
MDIRLASIKNIIAQNNTTGRQAFMYEVDLFPEGKPVTVIHTSPYYGKESGFVGLPEKGSMIVVCKPAKIETYFYLATCMNTSFGEQFGDRNLAKLSAQEEAIGKLGMPQKVVIKNPEGHMVTLCQNYDENKESMENGIHIKTKGGKYIKLEDAPKMNNIIIKVDDPEDEKNDIAFINIQQKSPEGNFEEVSAIGYSPAPYSIDMAATNPVNITSFKSDIKMQVVNGGQIDILNNSTGETGSDDSDTTPGNINITSTKGDINITAGGAPTLTTSPETFFGGTAFASQEVAAINIRTIGGAQTAINTETDGLLTLKGKAGVYISSETSVTIEAPSIILRSTGGATTTGPTTGVDAFFGGQGATTGNTGGGQIQILGGEITITGNGPVTNLNWP